MSNKVYRFNVEVNLMQYLYVKADSYEQAKEAVEKWDSQTGGFDPDLPYETVDIDITDDFNDYGDERGLEEADISEYVEE